jgi:S-methylmethionine-dependent homocysteine/selenocysteine methylase
MNRYRQHLPQLDGGLFLTDGGIETTLIFRDGLELPHFAAFHLLKDEAGTAALRRYFARYAGIARANGTGFILESPTWRASSDWGEKLGYSAAALADANTASIRLMQELRAGFES